MEVILKSIKKFKYLHDQYLTPLTIKHPFNKAQQKALFEAGYLKIIETPVGPIGELDLVKFMVGTLAVLKQADISEDVDDSSCE